MKLAAVIAVCATLTGCAMLMNSNRPSYSGPIVKAAWHNANIHTDRVPVIHKGTVYVLARPWEGRDYLRPYAFDLATGRQLWVSDISAGKIVLATDTILFVYTAGRLYSLDSNTGEDLKSQLYFRSAALSDGILYTLTGSLLEARAGLQAGKPLWQAEVPVTPIGTLSPVVAGNTVYVGSFSDFVLQPLKRAESGFYAFDAKTGALRWKWESRDRKGAPFIEGFSADANRAYLWMNDRSTNVFGFGVLISFDAMTGKENWTYKTSMYVPSCPGPLLLDPSTVLACDYPQGKQGTNQESGFLFQRLNRQNSSKVSEMRTPWKYNNGTVADGMLFASDHKVHEVLTENNNNSPDSWVSAVDLDTGKEQWRSEIIELAVLTPPAAGEGMVVVGSEIFTFNSVSGKREVAGLWAFPSAKR